MICFDHALILLRMLRLDHVIVLEVRKWRRRQMAEGSLLSPTFPPVAPVGAPNAILGRRLLVRKTVDYHATTLRFLQV